MSKEATDKVLGLAALEQAEYRAAHDKLPAASSPAAGRNSEGAVRKGSQAASSGPTPPAVSNNWLYGGGGPGYASTTTNAPVFGPVDSDRGDLLDFLANEHPEIPSKAEEWEHFRKVLAEVAAQTGGVIDQNLTRPRLHGVVAPQRVGPMFRRACREGLIRPNGYTVTDSSESGNVGRPAKSYDWLQGATA